MKFFFASTCLTGALPSCPLTAVGDLTPPHEHTHVSTLATASSTSSLEALGRQQAEEAPLRRTGSGVEIHYATYKLCDLR